MHSKRLLKGSIFIFLLCIVLLSCAKEGGTPSLPNEAELLDRIESQFTFTPNQNFEAIYFARRIGSNLDWYFHFRTDGTLEVLFTTDTQQDFSFPGTYTYSNDAITIQMQGGPTMPFPNGLNETSTVIMPQFGLVAAFATPEMVAICIGHGYNTVPPPGVNANYDCPIINIEQETSEDNAIEFIHRAVPTGFAVAGSIFRQKETWIREAPNPVIRRGYGIYRQMGNTFYATFRIPADFVDFARGRLPVEPGTIGVPFDDYNVISGSIDTNGRLIVDQLDPEAGPCQLRP